MKNQNYEEKKTQNVETKMEFWAKELKTEIIKPEFSEKGWNFEIKSQDFKMKVKLWE